MCTVVCAVDLDVGASGEVRILALRDEFVGRGFDEPAAWWPDQPTAIGGRDRVAGGTWCASDVRSGVTALLVNRPERPAGTPSRGLLPLAALAHGAGWADVVDPTMMASFSLVLAAPDGITVWSWDATTLHRADLAPGTHLVTPGGVDSADPRTRRYGPRFGTEPWRDVLDGCAPSAADDALVVSRQVDDRTYGTVFGQFVTATPGQLQVVHTRTPWVPDSWHTARWSDRPQ